MAQTQPKRTVWDTEYATTAAAEAFLKPETTIFKKDEVSRAGPNPAVQSARECSVHGENCNIRCGTEDLNLETLEREAGYTIPRLFFSEEKTNNSPGGDEQVLQTEEDRQHGEYLMPGERYKLTSRRSHKALDAAKKCDDSGASDGETHDDVGIEFEELGHEKSLANFVVAHIAHIATSKQDPEAPCQRAGPPTILSWKDPLVDSADIPACTPKHSISDVTDLGDREFYAAWRSSVAGSMVNEGQESLSFQDRLFEARMRVHEEKKGFFPRAVLSMLVTEDSVAEELAKSMRDTHSSKQIREYARDICQETPLPPLPGEVHDRRPPRTRCFKRIFTVLTMISKTSSITKFLEEDINDLHLPLIKHKKSMTFNRFDLGSSKLPAKKLECFQNFDQNVLQWFEEWQWTTISPFFHKGIGGDVEHFPLDSSVILPFTSDSRRDDSIGYRAEIEGGYGRVYRVGIHPDHHNFTHPKFHGQYFAIKRLNSPSKEDFRREVEMLKTFCGSKAHPHLISLFATYEQFGCYNLIFPWADGDLNWYWKTFNPSPAFTPQTVIWVAEQCRGIANGLLQIHKFKTSNSKLQAGFHENRYGRHGDLKPENILWFPDPKGGTLKISDFGLCEYSTVHSKSYRPKSAVVTSMSYRPPECDIKGGQIGQSYDIWTLGCLYLEFITWLLGGWNLVKQFETERMLLDPVWGMYTDTFFELVEFGCSRAVGATVKPAVTVFINKLHEHTACTEFLHEFITMIQQDMLMVKPCDPTEKGRISSSQLNYELGKMVKKCQNSIFEYASQSAPWCSLQLQPEEVIEVDATDSAAEMLPRVRLRHYYGQVHQRPQPVVNHSKGS